MIEITGELEADIRERLAHGGYSTPEELLGRALHALDAANSWLEKRLLEGLESGFEEVTDETWDEIEREALEQLRRRGEL